MKSQTFTSVMTLLTTFLHRASAAPLANPNPNPASIDVASLVPDIKPRAPVAELVARHPEPEAEAKAEAEAEAYVVGSTVARSAEDWIIRAREAEIQEAELQRRNDSGPTYGCSVM